MPMSPSRLAPRSAGNPANTLLLMRFESPLLLDSSLYNRTVVAHFAGFSSTASSKFGASAADTNSSAIKITTNSLPNLAQTNHTIECWVYIPVAQSSTTVTIAHFPITPASSTTGQHLYYNGNGAVLFNDGATQAAATDPLVKATPYDQWFHLAAVQQGTCKRIYIDGILAGAATQAAPAGQPQFSSGGYIFGGTLYNNGSIRIDELRVSAACLYGSNFAPPTAPFGLASPPASLGTCSQPCPPPGLYTGNDLCDGDDFVSEYTDGSCGFTYVVIQPGGCL